jgi:hypothetical protein
MFGFILGAVAGTVAAYLGHERIRKYMERDVSSFRDRAADRLGDLGQRAGSALDRARSSIETSVKTGQEKLRATGTTDVSGGTQPSSGFDTMDRDRSPGGSRQPRSGV